MATSIDRNNEYVLTKAQFDRLIANNQLIPGAIYHIKDYVTDGKGDEIVVSNYATKTELSTKQDTIDDLSTIRSGAEAGATAVQDTSYVHTDNNYTTLEKEKLESIEEGAEVNLVNSVNNKTGAVIITKDEIGLNNVDNTSDLSKTVYASRWLETWRSDGNATYGNAYKFRAIWGSDNHLYLKVEGGYSVDVDHATHATTANSATTDSKDRNIADNIDRIDSTYVDKTTTIAGVNLQDNISAASLINGLGLKVTKTPTKYKPSLAAYGKITFNGQDTVGTLGGDWTGLNQEQLMNQYPFNMLSIKYVDSYNSSNIELGIKDAFLEMPNFYKKISSSEDGSLTIEISNINYTDEFEKVYKDDNFTKLNLAVYKAVLNNNFLHSISGYYPAVNELHVTALSQMPYYKLEDGSLRRAEYQDYRIRGAYRLLAIIYMGNRNSQEMFRGIVDDGWAGSVEASIGERGKTGTTDILGSGVISDELLTFDGSSLTSGHRPFKLLGVENPYGVVWENLYGCGHYNGLVYAYEGSEPLNSSQINPSSGTMTATSIQMPQGAGWQKGLNDHNGYLFPISVGSDSTHSVGDYHWYASGWRIFLVGCNLTDGSNAGLSSLRADHGFSVAFVDIGFRLSFVS